VLPIGPEGCSTPVNSIRFAGQAIEYEARRQIDILEDGGAIDQETRLYDPKTGETRHTVWFRVLKATGQVIYSGVYGTCRIPDGRTCVKVVFPLPRGNATVIMAISVGERGDLDLVSSGEGFGSPGFYFLLRDKRGRHFSQYIRSFRERIHVYVDDEDVLRTDHTLTLWKRRVLQLHYKITRMSGLALKAR